jgi:putative transposase
MLHGWHAHVFVGMRAHLGRSEYAGATMSSPEETLEFAMTLPQRDANGSQRMRCRRVDELCQAHSLTFSCFHRQPFLARDRSRQWMIEAIQLARVRHGFHLWAYVIMPEHVHLLLLPTCPDRGISAILTSLKQPVARRAVRFVHEHAPEFLDRMTDRQPNGDVAYRFWQRGGGYDRNLREPRVLWATIDYLHQNPVRRGLCQKPEDWNWSSARDFAALGPRPLPIDRESLPGDPRP